MIDFDNIEKYNLDERNKYQQESGFDVDIQNIGKNTQTIVHRIDPSVKEIHKGVFLKTFSMELGEGNFSNVYDLYWNSEADGLTPIIHSEKKPYYLLNYFEKNKDFIAVVNGSFFFLIDNVDREPKDYPFHFCLRDGKVIGLPSSDEPILYTKSGKIYAKKIRARGTVSIGGNIVTWIGGQSSLKKGTDDVRLYNSASAKLIKKFDKKTGVRVGSLDKNHIHTPKSDNVTDVVVDLDDDDELVISDIRKGGGVHFFEGHLILQMKSESAKFSIGDKVTPLTLDDLDLMKKTSGISINKSVDDPYFFVPERASSRDARTVVGKDLQGNIHFIVFDGSKYIPKFNGISATDIRDIFSKDKYEWAYFLDGGSSSRIITREENGANFYANRFAFKKISNEVFKWDWKRHRKLASSIALKVG